MTRLRPEEGDAQHEIYMPGARIGQYAVEKVLGGREGHGGVQSGMGVVYVVLNLSGNRFVLKTFQERFLSNPKVQQLFEREARTWISIGSHPNIVEAVACENIQDRLFILLEYVEPGPDGKNRLTDYLAGVPLPFAQTLRWSVQFCRAMEYANGNKVIAHRDIKPDNILITQSGDVKITDFGLCLALDGFASKLPAIPNEMDNRNPRLSLCTVNERVVCGTPGYMAPELLATGRADCRSDIFSFGVVLYQMLTGSPLPPALTGGRKRLESELSSVAERCLRPRPEDRFADFADLRKHLERLLDVRHVDESPPVETLRNSAIHWTNKGTSLAALGQLEEALQCQERALELDPDYVNAWNNKGRTLRLLGRPEEAIPCYMRAMQLDPQAPIPVANLGNTYLALERWSEALPCYRKCLTMDPASSSSWYGLGECLYHLNDVEGAVRAFRRAVETGLPHHNKTQLARQRLAELAEGRQHLIGQNARQSGPSEAAPGLAAGRSEKDLSHISTTSQFEADTEEITDGRLSIESALKNAQARAQENNWDEAISILIATLRPGKLPLTAWARATLGRNLASCLNSRAVALLNAAIAESREDPVQALKREARIRCQT